MNDKKPPLPYRHDNKWGYIGIDGAVLQEARFAYSGPFEDGLAYVERDSSLIVIDETFRDLAAVKNAESYHAFSGGFLSVSDRDSGRDFFIDANGKRLGDHEFDVAQSFGGDRAFVAVREMGNDRSVRPLGR